MSKAIDPPKTAIADEVRTLKTVRHQTFGRNGRSSGAKFLGLNKYRRPCQDKEAIDQGQILAL